MGKSIPALASLDKTVKILDALESGPSTLGQLVAATGLCSDRPHIVWLLHWNATVSYCATSMADSYSAPVSPNLPPQRRGSSADRRRPDPADPARSHWRVCADLPPPRRSARVHRRYWNAPPAYVIPFRWVPCCRWKPVPPPRFFWLGRIPTVCTRGLRHAKFTATVAAVTQARLVRVRERTRRGRVLDFRPDPQRLRPGHRRHLDFRFRPARMVPPRTPLCAAGDGRRQVPHRGHWSKPFAETYQSIQPISPTGRNPRGIRRDAGFLPLIHSGRPPKPRILLRRFPPLSGTVT